MFGTVLRDVYRSTDRKAVWAALDDLCSPMDTVLWASTGLYAYFDPYGGAPRARLLYVGLAGDLADRFAQHNGLKGRAGPGNKRARIDAWFQSHELLGVAVMPQSPFAQVNTYRERRAVRSIPGDGPVVDNPDYGSVSATLTEGQLIAAHKIRHGQWPPWNGNGANTAGQRLAPTGSAGALLPLLDGSSDNLFCARRPIRCLSKNATFGFFESEALHLARMQAAMSGDSGPASAAVVRALARLAADPRYGHVLADQIGRIASTGYLGDNRDVVGGEFDPVAWARDACC